VTVQCATLAVPLDYKHPDGPKINLAISRIPAADPSQRRGVLLMNPGGPGSEGFDLPILLLALGLPQSVLDQYDLIGFDPRFVNFSAPVTCGLSAAQVGVALGEVPQPAGFDATVVTAQKVANSCVQDSGSVLPYATTENTARDMDEIRKALGETQISYLGYSYGTYLGAVYATLFPDHTDRFILDSAADPQWLWQRLLSEFGLGGQMRFPDFANYAAANNATYGFGDTPEDINKLFFTLRNRISQSQTPVTVNIEGAPVLPLTGNGYLFADLTHGALATDSDFPILAQVWQSLLQQLDNPSTDTTTGTGTATFSVAMTQPASTGPINTDVPVDNAEASALSITCGDVVWPKAIAEYKANFEFFSDKYPMFGSIFSSVQPCAFWPTRNTPVSISSQGPHNIMVIQNQRDPDTPYVGALQMNADLGRRTTFVGVDQGGHGVYVLTPNACANNAATAFLTSGTFPGGFVSCPADTATSSQTSVSTNAWSKQLADSEREHAQREFRRRMSPLKVPVLTK